jgi:hypothetical protein
MADKGKGLAVMLLGKGKPKEGPSEDGEAYEAARDDAAASVLSAIQGGDEKALGAALESFMDVCNGKPMEPDGDEE